MGPHVISLWGTSLRMCLHTPLPSGFRSQAGSRPVKLLWMWLPYLRLCFFLTPGQRWSFENGNLRYHFSRAESWTSDCLVWSGRVRSDLIWSDLGPACAAFFQPPEQDSDSVVRRGESGICSTSLEQPCAILKSLIMSNQTASMSSMRSFVSWISSLGPLFALCLFQCLPPSVYAAAASKSAREFCCFLFPPPSARHFCLLAVMNLVPNERQQRCP